MAIAEKTVRVPHMTLMDVVKGLVSKFVVEALKKRGLYVNDNVTVFCNKTSEHGDLLVRKEFLMSILKDDLRLKVILQITVTSIIETVDLCQTKTLAMYRVITHTHTHTHTMNLETACPEITIPTPTLHGRCLPT